MSEAQHNEETILDRLYNHAQTIPDRLAFRFLREGQKPETLTYGQLARRVASLAVSLRKQADQGDRALLLYPPGLEFIEAFLGCLAAGIIAVPAYPPRRNRSSQRLAAIINDALPRLVLTTRQIAPSLTLDESGWSDGLTCLATDGIETDLNSTANPPVLPPDGIAFLQYTSGSTASPRGVIVSHRNLTTNQRQIQASFAHTRESVMVSWLPVFHDMGLVGGVLQPLFVGFPAVLLSPVAFLQEPVRWLQAITEYRGTTTGAPNFAYDHCVRRVSAEEKKRLDLSCLDIAYNGAEPVRADTLDRFCAAFATCGFRPNAFFPCYGLAEATLFVSGGPPLRPSVRFLACAQSLEQHVLRQLPQTDRSGRCLVSSGRLASETKVEIVDPEARTRCPPNRIGEIWIASANVALGYWNCPDATEEFFSATLADSGEGPFLQTGDLGFLKGGELFVTGRLKDLIIIRGRNLYPQDIETALQNALTLARPNTCATFGIAIDGEEQLAVVIEADRTLAQTVRPSEAATELDRLVERISQVISDEFEINVHTILLLTPGTFPRTSSGKLQRRACREAFIAGNLCVLHSWSMRSRAGGADPLTNRSSATFGENLPNAGQHSCKAAPRNNQALSDAAATCAAVLREDPETVQQIDPTHWSRHVNTDTVEPPDCSSITHLLHDTIRNLLQSELNTEIGPIRPDTPFQSLGVDSMIAAAIALAIEKKTGCRVKPEILQQYNTIAQLAAYIMGQATVHGNATHGASDCRGKS